MGADAHAQAAERAPAGPIRSPAVLRAENRRFWIGVGCAALAHSLLLVGFLTSPPRMVGERDGKPDGFSVELVDAADLTSRDTVPTPDQAPPSPAAQPSNPSPPSPPVPPAPAPAPEPPQPQEAAAAPTESEKAPPLPLRGPSESERSQPAEKKAQPQPKAQPQAQPKEPAKAKPPLQLSLPSPGFAPGGFGASVERPPGVTRSGENDAFAREVIRSLRKTMPPATGALGRVTIRLFLNDKGNLTNVVLVRGSDDPPLNQSVMFAVRQTSFPIPPDGATAADLTFQVTYVYH